MQTVYDAAGGDEGLLQLAAAWHTRAAESVAGDPNEGHWHDEARGTPTQHPAWVVLPESADEVAAVLKIADERGIPVTARGSGTGLSGAAGPCPGGIVVSFERMKAI